MNSNDLKATITARLKSWIGQCLRRLADTLNPIPTEAALPRATGATADAERRSRQAQLARTGNGDTQDTRPTATVTAQAEDNRINTNADKMGLCPTSTVGNGLHTEKWALEPRTGMIVSAEALGMARNQGQTCCKAETIDVGCCPEPMTTRYGGKKPTTPDEDRSKGPSITALRELALSLGYRFEYVSHYEFPYLLINKTTGLDLEFGYPDDVLSWLRWQESAIPVSSDAPAPKRAVRASKVANKRSVGRGKK